MIIRNDTRKPWLTEAGDAGGSEQELRSLAQHTNSQTTDKYVKTNQTQILNLTKKRRAHQNVA
jgi:hypothetical protein